MKVTDEVFVLRSTAASYVYLIKGPENVLIDTGVSFNYKGILKDLKALGIPVETIRHILITHNDVDHIGNAFKLQKLSGASVWASKEDKPFITNEKKRYGIKRMASRLMHIRLPQKIHAFTHDDFLYGIKVIPTPGHTPGHVCFLYKNVLFSGDLFSNKKGVPAPFPAIANWNHELLLQSVKTVNALLFIWICTGHGGAIKCSKTIPE